MFYVRYLAFIFLHSMWVFCKIKTIRNKSVPFCFPAQIILCVGLYGRRYKKTSAFRPQSSDETFPALQKVLRRINDAYYVLNIYIRIRTYARNVMRTACLFPYKFPTTAEFKQMP
jgi:hypothetical protein